MLGSYLPNNAAEAGDAKFGSTCKFLEYENMHEVRCGADQNNGRVRCVALADCNMHND